MKNHYQKPEDFVLDKSFVNYCFKNKEEDVFRWERWLEQNPEKQEMACAAKELIFHISIKVPPEEKQEEWNKIKWAETSNKKRSLTSRKHRKIYRKIGAAAALILILVGVWWMMKEGGYQKENVGQQVKKETVSTQSYQTKYGELKEITLKDGTQVWLNADSKLSYISNFKSDAKREVSLSGEAYFKVSKKAHQPFIVHTDRMDILVLGTAFNVKAYPNDKLFEATLVSGAVNVRLKKYPSKEIKLAPQEKITVFNGAPIKNHFVHKKMDSLLSDESFPKFAVSGVEKDPHLNDKVLETVWRQGKLAFKNKSFGELALQLNHRYGVTFHFENETLKGYRYTGIFTKESLKEVLNALQLTSTSHPFKYRIEKNKVFISK